VFRRPSRALDEPEEQKNPSVLVTLARSLAPSHVAVVSTEGLIEEKPVADHKAWALLEQADWRFGGGKTAEAKTMLDSLAELLNLDVCPVSAHAVISATAEEMEAAVDAPEDWKQDLLERLCRGLDESAYGHWDLALADPEAAEAPAPAPAPLEECPPPPLEEAAAPAPPAPPKPEAFRGQFDDLQPDEFNELHTRYTTPRSF